MVVETRVETWGEDMINLGSKRNQMIIRLVKQLEFQQYLTMNSEIKQLGMRKEIRRYKIMRKKSEQASCTYCDLFQRTAPLKERKNAIPSKFQARVGSDAHHSHYC